MSGLFSGFAPPMSPGEAGVGGFTAPLVDDPNTALGQQGSGGGMDFSAIAKALGANATPNAQKPAVANLPGASGQATPGQAASAAYSGNPASLNALVQMLMQRVQALRTASNPAAAQPVNLGGGSRPSGLLGL